MHAADFDACSRFIGVERSDSRSMSAIVQIFTRATPLSTNVNRHFLNKRVAVLLIVQNCPRITAVRRRDHRLRWMQKREAGEQRNKNQRECIRFHRRAFCLFCSPHGNGKII